MGVLEARVIPVDDAPCRPAIVSYAADDRIEDRRSAPRSQTEICISDAMLKARDILYVQMTVFGAIETS